MLADNTADFVIVGAGIVGLALGRELKRRRPSSRVIVFEKELGLGYHASGRNSGVLHSGLYYGAGSLKARICAQGARELAEYCDEYGLPIRRCGKVIVPVRDGEDSQLDVLQEQARSNGARAELVDAQVLALIEPDVRSYSGRALHVPGTAVVDPLAILAHLQCSLERSGVEVMMGSAVHSIDAAKSTLRTRGRQIAFGHFFNAAGLHADRVARAFGVGSRYVMLPFKGRYRRVGSGSALRINGLVYPVPDVRVPFLGVHFTRGVDGVVHVGPTATPALGRENYHWLQGINPLEAAAIAWRIGVQYALNGHGFRRFAHRETTHLFTRWFVDAARALVPRLRASDLVRSDKVGIRAQLLDRHTHELVMDFVIEHGERSTHVLNAVSPAFTSAFPFARLVLDKAGVS